ncbi:MAG: hypothetical protein ACFFB2_14105 [Promethearchaeota archaeon]
MQRYAICLGYLPTLSYSGFSNQLHDPQNIFTQLCSAFRNARLIESEVDAEIRYASRTDRGVGALGQVLSLKTKQAPILSEINFYLPDPIQVLGLTKVSSGFHPRRDANLRTYSYFLVTDEKFDITLARETLSILIGKHDFRNFAKNDPKKEVSTVKDLKTADIFTLGDKIYQIRLSSKSFLWQQVRRIIGHLIEISAGKYDLQYTYQLLEAKRTNKKPPTAPPENLILESVQYKDLQFEYDQKSLQLFHHTLKEHLMEAKAKVALYDFSLNHFLEKIE